MLGLKRGVLGFSEYDDKWPELFQAEKERLASVLKDDIVGFEHIGSTSVKGLLAKPIIDIAITFEDEEKLDNIIDKLVSKGYTYKGLHDSNVHWYFVYNEQDVSMFHIHVWKLPSAHYQKHIIFRDNLRKHDFLRDEYAELKLQLAESTGWDRTRYTDLKGDFIEKVIHYESKE